MTVYLSGPMTGCLDLNIGAFIRAKERLKGLKVKVVDPHDISRKVNRRIKSPEYSDYMRADLLALLQKCDAILMLSGWKESRGARLEYLVAKTCGLRIFFEKNA